MENTSQPSADASKEVSGVEEKPVDSMEVFSKQLEDIINTYGSACSLMEEKISILEKYEENLDEETKDLVSNTGASSNSGTEQTANVNLEGVGNEASLLLQRIKNLISPEEKLETVMSQYTELLKEQRDEKAQLELLQKRHGVLVKQRDQLQLEHTQGILARSKLESLCHDLHKYNMTLKEDMLKKCQEDERKRAEITSHFQSVVVDIQNQIEHHSNRNNKLCQENSELANKLTSIIQQYEKREESLEKIFKQKNLQQQLSDGKLEEANLRLKEAEEKHKREKEYLLKEAIEKTKKCFTMKEQELHLKKQLVLYSQKFDDFQSTLAKSNEVYATFKQEMDKMNKNMKKLEKESNVWKVRFESCNKALTEMIAERSEKGKELELFTLKIDKLETLCRTLQEERKVLYEKIKEIRWQTTSASEPVMDIPEIPEIPQLPVSEPVRNPALTAEMEKLWKEQERLQQFAASLMASTADDMGGSDSEEESSEHIQLVSLVPVPIKPPTFKLDSITEEQGLEAGTERVRKSQTHAALETESKDQEKEPPKEESPKVEPPKTETHKAEATKVVPPIEEPPKAEPFKEEGAKEPPQKAEPPKAEPPKEEPPKVEARKVDPPKEEPTKEPPKTDSAKVEPPKAELTKTEPPKEPTQAEPPKADSPKVEPPKEGPKADSTKTEPPKEPTKSEPPKAEPTKEEPPKVEAPKVEPPKEEPTKEPPKTDSAKVETPKAEPPKEGPKAESSKTEPPKEPTKEEPPKADSPKVEPPKEGPKAELPKEEPTKDKPAKVEPPKAPSKVPTRNVAKVQPIKKNTTTQKSNRPNSADHKETKSKDVKGATDQSESLKVHASKNEHHTEQEPKEASSSEVEPKKAESHSTEPRAPEAFAAAAAKAQNSKSSEVKPSAGKSKKQGSSKKKGAAKSVKKS